MTFQEQLEAYPPLKEMLLTIPFNVGPETSNPLWRIYARKTDESNWARKDFFTYKAAFDFFKLKRKIWHDVSITSKRVAYIPPGRWVKLKKNGEPVMVKTPTGMRQATKLVPIRPPVYHLWCRYCRRFTIFTFFLKHHAFPATQQYDPTARRCCICGIREETGAYR
jgi:hypothetical protein